MLHITLHRIQKRFKRTFDYIVNKSKYTDRKEEKSIISSEGSSVAIRNGNIHLSAGKNVHIQLDRDNQTKAEVSMQSHTVTNRKRIDVDEIIINDHKLNPKLYEWTDMRYTDSNNIVGRLQMEGTILVKAWDEQLQRHVLIRRQCRQPLFGETLNMAEIPENMSPEELLP